MSTNNTIKFVSGMVIKAKEFDTGGMILKVGVKVADFDEFMCANVKDTGWLNIDIKKSKAGEWYACLDEYQSKKSDDIDDSNIPF